MGPWKTRSIATGWGGDEDRGARGWGRQRSIQMVVSVERILDEVECHDRQSSLGQLVCFMICDKGHKRRSKCFTKTRGWTAISFCGACSLQDLAMK